MRVALALGSGGARGYAHIGVIEVLQERGHEVTAIAGTSMGAVVGGVAAAHKLPEFTEWARGLNQRDVIRLLDLRLLGPGAFRAERVVSKLREITDDPDIEELPIPFTAVATDLSTRREVWFQHGPLYSAVRASFAIPGVFTPVQADGRILVDGGLLNPVPVDATAAAPADLTIAVSLSGTKPHARAEKPLAKPRRDLLSRVRRSTEPMDAEDVDEEQPSDPQSKVRMTELMAQSFDAMQGLITRYRLATQPPDIHLTVPVDACKTLDFHRADEMINLGRKLAEIELDRTDPDPPVGE